MNDQTHQHTLTPVHSTEIEKSPKYLTGSYMVYSRRAVISVGRNKYDDDGIVRQSRHCGSAFEMNYSEVNHW